MNTNPLTSLLLALAFTTTAFTVAPQGEAVAVLEVASPADACVGMLGPAAVATGDPAHAMVDMRGSMYLSGLDVLGSCGGSGPNPADDDTPPTPCPENLPPTAGD